MQKLSINSDRFKKKPVKSSRSERAELIGQFLDRLNKDRLGTKFKPLTASRLGFMLCHMSVKELYLFLGQCKDAKHFSKYFFWRFKEARERPVDNFP